MSLLAGMFRHRADFALDPGRVDRGVGAEGRGECAFLIFEKGRIDLEVGPGWGRSRAGFAFDPVRVEL